MAVSELPPNHNGRANEPGLYLRTVHGIAREPIVARMDIQWGSGSSGYKATLEQSALVLSNHADCLEMCFDDPDTLLIRGSPGILYTLDFLTDSGPYDYIYTFSKNGYAYYMANCYKNRCRYLMQCVRGTVQLQQEWKESSSLYSRLSVQGKDGFLLVLREVETEWNGTWKKYDYDESRTAMDQ